MNTTEKLIIYLLLLAALGCAIFLIFRTPPSTDFSAIQKALEEKMVEQTAQLNAIAEAQAQADKTAKEMNRQFNAKIASVDNKVTTLSQEVSYVLDQIPILAAHNRQLDPVAVDSGIYSNIQRFRQEYPATKPVE